MGEKLRSNPVFRGRRRSLVLASRVNPEYADWEAEKKENQQHGRKKGKRKYRQQTISFSGKLANRTRGVFSILRLIGATGYWTLPSVFVKPERSIVVG